MSFPDPSPKLGDSDNNLLFKIAQLLVGGAGGAVGPQGPVGPDGPQGPAGDDGVTATNGQSFGAGTSYAATTTSSRVIFGTSQPDVVLPAAGTYLVAGLIRIQPGANTGDDYRAKLHNITAGVDVGTETAQPSVSLEDMSMPFIQLAVVAAPSTIVIFLRNATATRGVAASAVTHLCFVRLA